MVTILVIVVVVGLGVALYEIAASRRRSHRDTRAQLDALSRVVEPQRRTRRGASGGRADGADDGSSNPPLD